MTRKRQLLVALGVIAAVSLFIWFRYRQFPDTIKGDPLCGMADEHQMHCVKLASPAIYDHGAYVRFDQSPTVGQPVPLPTDYLFSEQCLVDPASAAFARFTEDSSQYVNFGSHVFSVDRNLSAGMELNLPRLAGLSLKAGPTVSNIRSVTLEAESARYFNIDTRAFLSALSGCRVRPACSAVVRRPGVHVIKRLLVAKNLRYRIDTTSGESESLVAAVRSKSLSVGMDAKGQATSVEDLSSGLDMVFAIDFFEPVELQAAAICDEPLAILKVTGATEASAFAGAEDSPGDHKSSSDGSEVLAKERAPDAPDRDGGMKDPEAQAWGLWNYDAARRTVSLHQRTMVDPGTRWLTDANLEEVPGSLRVWAIPKSSIRNEVEITIVNLLEETKVLLASAQLAVNTSASLTGRLPMYSSFHPLTLVSQDGTQHQVPPVWQSNVAKDFELGQINGGETVRVRIGRILEAKARRDDEAGAIQEDLSLTFSLR